MLTLAAFRGTNRPVLLVGNRGYLLKAEAAAAPYRDALRERAVSWAPGFVPQAVCCVLSGLLVPVPKCIRSTARFRTCHLDLSFMGQCRG